MVSFYLKEKKKFFNIYHKDIDAITLYSIFLTHYLHEFYFLHIYKKNIYIYTQSIMLSKKQFTKSKAIHFG